MRAGGENQKFDFSEKPNFCTGQDEGEMTIFTAKGQRGKEAERQRSRGNYLRFASSHLCLFAVKNSTIRLITTEKSNF
jgi:hypothetical protein